MVGAGQTVITVMICSTVLISGFISGIEGSRCQLNTCTCTPYRISCDQAEDSRSIKFSGVERMDVKYVVLTWNARGLLGKMCSILPNLQGVYISPGINGAESLECSTLPSSCTDIEVSCV